jgi:hypothetical protein
MQGRIQHTITDKNGHQKIVWVTPDKKLPSSAEGRNRVVGAVPTISKKPLITSGDIENWAARNNLPFGEDEDFVDLVNATVIANDDYTDGGLQNAYDEVFRSNFGGYSVDSLRAALGVSAEPTAPVVPSSSDPRVQAGEVLDEVEHDGVVYHRVRDGVYPTDIYSMRFQFDRKLSVEEARHARDLIAYAWTSKVRGEPFGTELQDSPFSFVAYGDVTKTRRDDSGQALAEWEETLAEYLAEGTKQKNESLRIPPVTPALKVEIYYDNVEGDI